MSPSMTNALARTPTPVPRAAAAAPAVVARTPRQAPAVWVPRVDSLAEFGLKISRQLTQCRRYGGQLAVLWLDARLPTDEAGLDTHEVREELMLALARRLRSRVRSTDLVLQVGEASFAVLLVDAGTREADIVVHRLRTVLQGGYAVGDALVPLTLALGAAAFPEGGCRGAELAENARQAVRRC